jgi:RND family efflux transporter MFP subunit
MSVTHWTDSTELFAEYPQLVTDVPSRFAIHLTHLDTFKPVTVGKVEVRLLGGQSPTEVFQADSPSRPGIFGVDVTASTPGVRELVVVLSGPSVRDEHRLGRIEVFPTIDAARLGADEGSEDPTGIAFLKEQQWALDFGTAVVTESEMRESLRVPARLEARPDGTADVVAPVNGRLTHVVEQPVGSTVSRGQELARILPSPSTPGDLPQLQRELAEAKTALARATRDRERAERLTRAGAAPERRLDEARSVEEQEQARLAAAEASLSQYNAARSGGATAIEGLFLVRAPFSGVVAQRDAVPGANVSLGSVLFHLVDTAQVHVVGQIPETEVSRARRASTAEIETAGESSRVPAGRLIAVGKVLDAASRTLPIVFAVDNRTLGLPIGQAVFLHLLIGTAAARPVVPPSAVVDDGGRPIVFVQRAGETFERRPVTLGPRAGDRVQVLDGLQPGERVVTKGAYLVRLATLSATVPAHGHVH